MCPHPPHPPPPPGSPTTWKHNVFLCFRGKDTREGFTSHLFQALNSYGIDTFMDDRLPKGRHISELLDRIKRSRISVVIFSENFASSRWCLDELVKILECKGTIGQEVLPVFYKVPASELRDLRKGKTGEYLAKHRDMYGVSTEKIEQWRHAVKSFADLHGWHFTQGIESRLVSEIVKTVHSMLDVKITGGPPADQVTLEVDDDGGSLAGQPEETTLEVDDDGGSLAGRPEETTLEVDDDGGSLAGRPEETTLEVDDAGGSLAGRPEETTLEVDDAGGSLAGRPEETTLEVDDAGGSLAGRPEETPKCGEPVRIAILILFCAISLFIFLSICQ